MASQPIKPISFGYSNILKTLYKTDKLPIKKGIYGGILTKNNVTLEHIRPHSKKGATALHNLVLATRENNEKRGNAPLSEFYNKEKAREYFEQFVDLVIPYKDGGKKQKYFNGNQYILDATNSINRELLNEHRLDLIV